jgi:hypothetical protein
MSCCRKLKSKFQPNEDALLIKAVDFHGTSDWPSVAAALPGRNARQCRERWNNYVNPELTRGHWTEAEDKLLLELFRKQGSKWTWIATHFKRRATNSVHNRVLAIQRRQARDGCVEHSDSIPINEDITEMTGEAAKRDAANHDPLTFLDAVAHEAISWSTASDLEVAEPYFF